MEENILYLCMYVCICVCVCVCVCVYMKYATEYLSINRLKSFLQQLLNGSKTFQIH